MLDTALGRKRPHASYTGEDLGRCQMLDTALGRKRPHASYTGEDCFQNSLSTHISVI